MTVKEVQSLVKQGENQNIEFKRKVAHPEKILREVVAFANSKGGHLLIGVDDQGNMPGILNAKEEALLLEEAIEKYCRPKITYEKELIHLSRKRMLLLYTILESKHKPHYVVPPDSRKTAYLRINDMSVKASREVREILKRKHSNKGIHFHYSEKEKWLLQYLQVHQSITLNQYEKLTDLTVAMASKTLVILVLANLLEIIPREKDDLFMLKEN